PEQVQRRAPVVVAHPDPEEPCNVELETCFLAHLAPQTVEWMFSLTDESTDDVPRSPKRLARAPREEDSTALLRKRACSHGRVRAPPLRPPTSCRGSASLRRSRVRRSVASPNGCGAKPSVPVARS